jgi:hypothetical protein
MAQPDAQSGWLALARQHAVDARGAHRSLVKSEGSTKAVLLNLLGSLEVTASCTLTFDGLLGCLLTTVCTLWYWKYKPDAAASMTWTAVSMAVIFPISQGISIAFKRREQALAEFGALHAHCLALWGAAHTWNCKNKDGEFVPVLDLFEDPEQASKDLWELWEGFLAALVVYFQVPRSGRARQQSWLTVHCCGGDREQLELESIAIEQRIVVEGFIFRMQRLVQKMKTKGLSGGEAHRLDQYISKIGISFGRLSLLKEYRTPMAFRAFARVYILFIGAAYAPYYIQLAQGMSGKQDNIGLSICFACGMQLAMSGLFHVMLGLEDPFSPVRVGTRRGIDSVKVAKLVTMTRAQLQRMRACARMEWCDVAQRGGSMCKVASNPIGLTPQPGPANFVLEEI